MKSIKKSTIFLFLLLTTVCFGQNGFSDFGFWQKRILEDENLDLVKQSLQSDDYVISFDKAEIPTQLIHILSAWKNQPFSIANPDEDYNPTDAVDDSLPDRQLISIFRNNEFIVIHYRHGGVGYHHHVVWCKIQNSRINDIWICNTYNTINNLSELKKEIEDFTRSTTLKNGKTVAQNLLCF